MLGNNWKENKHEYLFLGNFYGLHDGYDGSIFCTYGVAPCLVASLGRIPQILVEVEDENRRNK